MGVPAISVCVGSVRPETLPATIRAIQAQSVLDWELLLVLQGPDYPVGAIERAAAGDDRIRILRDREFGLSRARNLAIREASAPVLAFTDDDCLPETDWLEVTLARFRADPGLGVLGGAVTAGPKERWGPSTCPAIEPGEMRLRPGSATEQDVIGFIGANMAMTAEAARRIGPFDDLLGAGAPFLGGEDVDYRMRAAHAGIAMATTSASRVYHRYGRRYGLSAVWKHLGSYAYSTGAVAGKLSLEGHRSGEEWRQHVAREVRASFRLSSGPVAPARSLIRWWYFRAGYRDVTKGCAFDRSTGCLVPA
jgi:GT2 family glycosyltransferase